MRMMLLSVLMLMAFSCCSGKPTYNPRSREDIVTTALDATIDQLNSQSWGKNLLRLSRTGEIKIKPLSQVRGRKDAGDVSEVSLQFTVRETTCNKNTAIDLSECEFQAGQQMETPCESRVLISQGKAMVLKAHCNLHMSSSSESHSSEEVSMRSRSFTPGIKRTEPERFPYDWDPYGRKQQKANPRWEEEEDHYLME